VEPSIPSRADLSYRIDLRMIGMIRPVVRYCAGVQSRARVWQADSNRSEASAPAGGRHESSVSCPVLVVVEFLSTSPSSWHGRRSTCNPPRAVCVRRQQDLSSHDQHADQRRRLEGGPWLGHDNCLAGRVQGSVEE
jgi:hypothetical protein